MEPEKRMRFAVAASCQTSALAGGQQFGETLSRIEERLRQLPRGAAMLFVVAVDLRDSRHGLSHVTEAEQPPAGREALTETGLLGEHGAAAGEVGDTPIAEPSRLHGDVDGLGAHELGARTADVLLILRRGGAHPMWVGDSPAVFPKQVAVARR